MIIPRPLRIALTAALAAASALLLSCKTTPEDTPAEDPPAAVSETVDKDPETPDPGPVETPPTPEADAPASLSQEDIDAARAAVQRANLMGANRYFPSDYRDLLDKLNAAVARGESDPDSARTVLKEIIAAADDLRLKTLTARRDEYEQRYRRGDEALLAIEADKFAPAEYRATVDSIAAAKAMFEAEDYSGARMKADETLESQGRLHYNLSENIRYVGILRRDTESYLGDAEDNDAFLYAPAELEDANESYFSGISAYRAYDIEGSAEAFTNAKRQAVLAARRSAVRRKQAETDAVLADTQRRLESASNLRTLNTDGSVNTPRPWEGDSYLASNPLVDHSENVGEVDIEDPELRRLDEPVTDGSGAGAADFPADVPIENEGTQVNADEQNEDYLALAESLWQKGVSARNEAQFDLANDYFRRAQAYIDLYESNAVSQTYTVVYREVDTDCLWRISERPEIFANPFLWPKIWRANRRIIQNPDLIYPGQILAIPPK